MKTKGFFDIFLNLMVQSFSRSMMSWRSDALSSMMSRSLAFDITSIQLVGAFEDILFTLFPAMRLTVTKTKTKL